MNLDHNGQSDAPSTERMTGRRANREAHVHSHVSQARRGAKRVVWGIYHHGFSSRKRVIISLLILLFVPIIVVQLFYSHDSLLPNMSVGSVSLSGMSRDKATKALNDAYDAAKVPIYFSDSDEVVIRPSLADLGVETDNEARVAAYDYPVWARFVPYSLFWYQSMIERGEPKVFYNTATTAGYINIKFGEDCEFAPVSATIAYRDDALRVIEATRGGSCDPLELRSKLAQVPAQLEPARITINGTSTAPEIHTAEAEKEMARLQRELSDGVAFVVDGETRTLKQATVEPWIVYSTEGGELTLGVSGDVFNDWLADEYGERFTKDAGISVVKLVDYAEASRESGKEGKYINNEATAANLVADLHGDSDTTELKVETIDPAVTYERSYSPSNAALSKVMENYANTHAGTYGVKMVELSGQRRNAEYRSTTLYTTASTYKMFVAYSVLLRIERGEYTWDQASYGGLSVSACFDRMIELSNNECAVWFLLDIGQANVTQDAHDIGATETTFLRNDGIKSNAANEAHLLSLLYTGQILSQQASRDRMIEAMKGNVYVKGIPSGIPNATIADKVGFLDGWLHDAAIVYSPKGDYVLIILTEYSSWANIAELAGEIEAAR